MDQQEVIRKAAHYLMKIREQGPRNRNYPLGDVGTYRIMGRAIMNSHGEHVEPPQLALVQGRFIDAVIHAVQLPYFDPMNIIPWHPERGWRESNHGYVEKANIKNLTAQIPLNIMEEQISLENILLQKS